MCSMVAEDHTQKIMELVPATEALHIHDSQDPSFDGDLFVDERHPPSARICRDDGEHVRTMCFAVPFIDRPHHHRLSCGHDITTSKPEACAANCMPLAVSVGSSSYCNPSDGKLACPEPECESARVIEDAAYRSMFISKRKITHRACQLSHVYGVDEKKDAARLVEKQAMIDLGIEGYVVRDTVNHRGQRIPSSKRKLRKRSVSPTGFDAEVDLGNSRATAKQPKSTIKFKSDLEIEGEMIALYGREMAMILKECNVRPKRHATGRIMTESEIREELKSDEAFNKFEDLHMEGKEALRQQQKARWTAHTVNDPSFAYPDRPIGENLGEGTEVDEDFIRKQLPRRQKDVDFKLEMEKHCVCRNIGDGLMFPCDQCGLLFHPGCIGKGKFKPDMYGDTNRYICFQKDAASFVRQHKSLRCAECEGKEDDTLKELGPRVVKAWKRQQSGRLRSDHFETGIASEREEDRWLRRLQVGVQARVEMEKSHGVHPSQPLARSDSVSARRARKTVAHAEATKVAGERWGAMTMITRKRKADNLSKSEGLRRETHDGDRMDLDRPVDESEGAHQRVKKIARGRRAHRGIDGMGDAPFIEKRNAILKPIVIRRR